MLSCSVPICLCVRVSAITITWKLREAKSLGQGYTARKWQIYDLNPALVDSRALKLYTLFAALQGVHWSSLQAIEAGRDGGKQERSLLKY